MKNLFRIPFAMFVASLIFVGCSKDEADKAITNNQLINESNDFSRIPSYGDVKHPFFPKVSDIEKIDPNTEYGLNLIADISLVGDYDIDTSNMEKINMEGLIDYNVFSIPYNSSNLKLIVLRNDDFLSVAIGKQSILKSGNILFEIFNYQGEDLFKLEQNSKNMFGNVDIYNNESGFFSRHHSTSTPGGGAPSGSCLNYTNFNDCMQCAWEQCSESWVCGAILALKPLEIIASAALLCGGNAILNAH